MLGYVALEVSSVGRIEVVQNSLGATSALAVNLSQATFIAIFLLQFTGWIPRSPVNLLPGSVVTKCQKLDGLK